jgi:hypothetical protein
MCLYAPVGLLQVPVGWQGAFAGLVHRLWLDGCISGRRGLQDVKRIRERLGVVLLARERWRLQVS